MFKDNIHFYGDDCEGAEIDCPYCSGTAIVTDSGTYCPDCADED